MDNMEQRVWERVLAQPAAEPGRLDIRPLMLAAQELAYVYRRLMRTADRRRKALLQKLHEGEMANIACLRGIGVISGGEPGKITALSGEPGPKALEKCYHRTRRALMEYAARSAEPEFGVVFRAMADREEEQCALILELLGKQLR